MFIIAEIIINHDENIHMTWAFLAEYIAKMNALGDESVLEMEARLQGVDFKVVRSTQTQG